METGETITKFFSSNWLYLVIALVVLLIIVFVVISNKKKRIRRLIESYQIKVNNLKSHPFVVDIAKADGLARVNTQIQETSNQCKKDYDRLQQLIGEIISLVQDAYELLSTSSYSKAETITNKINPKIVEAVDITNKLKDTLTAILSANSMQRNKINELKAQFHDIKNVVNENPNDFTFCWEAMDNTTNEISHQFSDFEAIMDASKFDEAAVKSEEIKTAINRLNIIVSNLPEMISVAKDYIPACISQLQSKVELSKQENIFLQHLNIEKQIDDLSQKDAEILLRLKNCNIDNVEDDLVETQTVINQITVALDEERNAYKQLIELRKTCKNKLEEILTSIQNNDPKSFDHYKMNSDQKDFDSLKTAYKNNIEEFNSLEKTCIENTIPASVLLDSYNELTKDINSTIELKASIYNEINSNKTDEIRAKELLSRFTIVLNEAKAAIATSNLPSISTKYDSDIIASESYVTHLNELLANKQLNMKEINEILEKAQNLIVSLYKNVNNLIETANDIENYIILCNKYRPFYPDVDSILYTAELAYRNGEYTKAAKTIVTALAKIDPDTSKKLFDSINNKLNYKEA